MEYWLTRLCFQKALAVIYFVAFLICYKQFVALVGKSGILPASSYTRYWRFKEAPSLFLFWKSDGAFRLMSVVGLVLSLVAFTGISEQHGFFISAAVWCSLWFIYMSFVNVGGLFYSFGWEILLLETGFLAIFLGSYDIEPSPVIIWLLRFVLFKIMFGAGLIKLRADSCWKNLTSMFFHYETQPLPGPLSRFFHRLPPSIHKIEVLFTHFVELIVPFGLFWPSGVRITAGILTAFFQFVLMLSGNLSWLNHITFILCISCLDDHFLSHFISFQPTRGAAFSFWYSALTYVVALFLLYLNYKPIRNLLSKQQIMNCSFDPCHLANTYGAFGTVTRVRREVIIEGTSEAALTPATKWEEYAFKAKPGDPHKDLPRLPPIIIS